jgi:type IV pilus assembly protein PilO
MHWGPRQYLFILVLLAVPLASYLLVFRPQNREIARARTEIELKAKMLDKLREATAQAADLESSNREIASAIEAIRARLPDSKSIDTVLREVAQIASRHNLKIPVFKKDDKILPAGDAMEQPLDIDIQGDFDGFYRFLLDLERVPRITRLSDMKLTRVDDENGGMRAKVTMSIYYRPDTVATADASSAGGTK